MRMEVGSFIVGVRHICVMMQVNFVMRCDVCMSLKLNLATNMSTNVRGNGTVRLFTSNNSSKTVVQLPNTLYVPDLRCNLISVAKITDQG